MISSEFGISELHRCSKCDNSALRVKLHGEAPKLWRERTCRSNSTILAGISV